MNSPHSKQEAGAQIEATDLRVSHATGRIAQSSVRIRVTKRKRSPELLALRLTWVAQMFERLLEKLSRMSGTFASAIYESYQIRSYLEAFVDTFDHIETKVERITPSLAAAMLARVAGNGRVDKITQHEFERDMREGRWLLNGAPIIFSESGHVLDGRARLHACVAANMPFESLVVRGIAHDTFETIDSVRKRTLADVLSIRQEKHGRALASALRIIRAYQSGAVPGASKPPAPMALLSVLEENPSIRDSVLPGLRGMPLLPHGCAIAIHYFASRIDAPKADQFLSELGNPVVVDENCPVNRLREVLSRLRGQGGARRQTYVIAIAIKAWNSYRRGQTIKQLRYSPEEKFPRFETEPDWGPLSRTVPLPAKTVSNSHKIVVRVAMITPDMADAMLADRGPNRHVAASVINKYARDMAVGRWKLNGQTIKIASDGRLLDGQHRLEAAKKAKQPFPAIIVEGLASGVFSSLDIGRRRAMSDVLRERGEINTIILASSLRWLWMLKNGVVLAANSSPTNSELLDVLDAHPDIRLSLRHVAAIRDIMGSGIAAALHRSFAEVDPVRADEFFDRLIDGVQLAENSPIRRLRERLIKARTANRVRLPEAERMAISIKAWNAYREERPMQLLLWRNKGLAREPLPTVK